MVQYMATGDHVAKTIVMRILNLEFDLQKY